MVTGKVFDAKAGSMPAMKPPATCIVLVSTEVRTKMCFSFTDFRNPSLWL